MNRTEFQRVSPEAVGIPSKAILDILDFLEEAAYCEPHGLVIMRHGKICAEGFWAPYGKNISHTLFSMTKTYTATALGIAYTEGLIGLEDKVADHFLGNPQVQPYSPMTARISGKRFSMVDTDFTLRKSLWNHIADCDTVEPVTGIDWFAFDFSRVETCALRFLEQREERTLTIGLDGARRLNRYPMEKLDLDLVMLDGFWSGSDTFQVNARWIQTCYSISVAFRFGEDGVEILAVRVFGDFHQHPLRQKNARAKAY